MTRVLSDNPAWIPAQTATPRNADTTPPVTTATATPTTIETTTCRMSHQPICIIDHDEHYSHPLASNIARVAAIAPESSACSCARYSRVRRNSPSTVSTTSAPIPGTARRSMAAGISRPCGVLVIFSGAAREHEVRYGCVETQLSHLRPTAPDRLRRNHPRIQRAGCDVGRAHRLTADPRARVVATRKIAAKHLPTREEDAVVACRRFWQPQGSPASPRSRSCARRRGRARRPQIPSATATDSQPRLRQRPSPGGSWAAALMSLRSASAA